MNNVVCKYKAGSVDEGDGDAAWFPVDTYFWPKNGKLTFSAYYPSDLINEHSYEKAAVAVNAKTGIEIKNYTIDDPTKQVDVMYSTRVFDRISSTQTDVNKDYDGVDIVFNHALSAVSFKAKVKEDYGTDAVKINKIEIKGAIARGTFNEGYTTGAKGETAHPAWGAPVDAAEKTMDYVVFKETDGQVLNTDAKEVGVDCIVLPQTFTTGIVIEVSYSIKYKDGAGVKYLEQTATFPLQNTTTNNGTDIEAWEMGKWYHYSLTFTLDKVYFAPSVSDWENVIVDGIEVK